MWDALNSLELHILDFIREHIACPALDAIMPIITLFGEDGIFFIALAVCMLPSPKTRKTGISVGAALLMGFVIGNLILKPALARVRPYDFNEAYDSSQLLVSVLHDYSFPSGHTLCTFEGCMVLFLTQKKYIGIPALVLCSLVAFSRLYLYVHYPTDVITGALLGSLFAFLACRLVDKIYKKYEQKKKTAPPRSSKS